VYFPEKYRGLFSGGKIAMNGLKKQCLSSWSDGPRREAGMKGMKGLLNAFAEGTRAIG
jgi:hypothetical protein